MKDPSREIRLSFLAMTLGLIALGVVMVYSASAIYADQTFHDSAYFLKKHMVAILVGLGGAVAMMLLDYKVLVRYSGVLMFVTGIALVLVLMPGIGYEAGGARRWFRLAGFQVQPAEFAKLVVLLYLAKRISDHPAMVLDLKNGILKSLWPVALFLFMILLEKDLGTPAVIGASVILVLFASGMPWRYLGGFIGLSFVAFFLGVRMEPYRWERFMSFLAPWEDFRGAGFQLWQSFLALGSGGFWGVGLGMSQEKLFYLPGAHTDFIYSIIGEELGFFGGALVILLYIGIIVAGFMIVMRSPGLLGQVLGLSLIVLIGLEAVINIGVATGLLPTKGMALPFVSYGGSALVVKMITLGLLLNISRDA